MTCSGLHVCAENDCPYFGKVSVSSCACHQTDEQVLRMLIANLVSHAERHPLHVGYDNGPGGGNYIYADAVRTDDEEFIALEKAIRS